MHVEFDATVGKCGNAKHERDGGLGYYTTSAMDDHGCRHFVYLDSVTATGVDPVSWPPQVGDIWQAGSVEYFAREDVGIVLMSDDDDKPSYYEDEFGDFKALNPTIVRRRSA